MGSPRPPRRPHLAGPCCALAIAGLAAAARADEPTLDFAWDAPEGCPDRARVVAEIERLAGRPASGSGPTMSVKAVVTQSDQGMSVSITSGAPGETHERKVQAPTCKEAADATALIVALALNPALATPPDSTPRTADDTPKSGEEKAPAKRRSPARVPATSTERLEDKAPPEQPSSEKVPIRGEGRVMLAFDAGSLPAPAPGVAGALGLWIGELRVDAIATVFPEQRKTLAGGGGGDVGLATGGLAAWLAPVRAPVEVLVGLGIEGGAMWGHGFGVAGARSGSAPWVALWPAASVAYAFTPRLGASFAASLVVPLLQERFLLGAEDLFAAAPAALRLQMGLFARLP